MEGKVDGAPFVDSRGDDETDGKEDEVEHDIQEEEDHRGVRGDKKDDGEHDNARNGEQQRGYTHPLPLGKGEEDKNGDDKAKEQREGHPDNNQDENKGFIRSEAGIRKERKPGANHRPDERPPKEPVQRGNGAQLSHSISLRIFSLGSFPFSLNHEVVAMEKSDGGDHDPVDKIGGELPNANNQHVDEQRNSREEGEEEEEVFFARTPSEMDERHDKRYHQPHQCWPGNRHHLCISISDRHHTHTIQKMAKEPKADETNFTFESQRGQEECSDKKGTNRTNNQLRNDTQTIARTHRVKLFHSI